MRYALRIIRMILCIILLTGCGQESPQELSVKAEPWGGWESIQAGTLETEKLKVTTWSSGRCEATSENTMIEGENGYYYAYQEYLFYADKTDLSNWVLVCAKPDCDHNAHGRCSAALNSPRIVVRDGRIYTTVWSELYPELYKTEGSGYLLVSMAADGTDMKLEYAFTEALEDDFSNSFSFLSSNHWMYSYSVTDEEGNMTGYLYRITDKGPELVLKQENSAGASLFVMNGVAYGITPFWSELLDDNGELRFFSYYQDNELKTLDMNILPSWGCYISNGIARGFDHRERCYHDRDLETGEDTFLAEAQLNNSFGSVVLPNCILESTLLGSYSLEYRDENAPNAMKIFNGEQWVDVALTEELINAGRRDYLEIVAVTSDRIFLSLRNSGTFAWQTGYISDLYQILLTEDALQVQYCGQLQIPVE